ncbi:MAG: WD40 repeat domain-containing protein [Bacteroidales bacterium]|nr:WD40 repeat domain-containing protein [Bacteroidales bacterium]MBN2762656.1 WD40 repeat domain-containing protein [Bacteroidales bacterium]
MSQLCGQDDAGSDAWLVLNKHGDAVKSVAYSDDSSVLATGSDDKTIVIWDLKTGEPVTTIGNNYFPVKALQFYNNDELFVASGPDIKLIDLRGNIIQTYTGKTVHIWSLDFSRPTGRITAGSFGKTIRIWDIKSAKEYLLLEGHEKSTLPVCFSPKGNLLLSGSLDQSVRLWDADSGKVLRIMEGHSGNIFCVAFHPDGHYAASASADKTIRLWDLQTGEIVQSYLGHNSGILDIDFSPEGYHLLSCSDDNTIILWETISGKKMYSFIDHKAAVNAVEFNPDGKSFASASDDRTARVWKLENKIYAESGYHDEIENAIAGSPLFNARESGETRQDYKERQEKARIFLMEIYNTYYQKYMQQLRLQSFDELKK